MITKSKLYTDILVVGSGPSGFAAAYSAAKNGAKVVLVEQSGDVGGISTSGLMSHWTGSCGSPLYYEILKRSAQYNEGKFKNKKIPPQSAAETDSFIGIAATCAARAAF